MGAENVDTKSITDFLDKIDLSYKIRSLDDSDMILIPMRGEDGKGVVIIVWVDKNGSITLEADLAIVNYDQTTLSLLQEMNQMNCENRFFKACVDSDDNMFKLIYSYFAVERRKDLPAFKFLFLQLVNLSMEILESGLLESFESLVD